MRDTLGGRPPIQLEAGLIPAATVVIVRDSVDGPEVLLLRRGAGLEFAGGMWVFPGGRIDPTDVDPGYTGPARITPDELAAMVGEDPARWDAAERVAACREAAEESGLAVSPDQMIRLSHWTPPPETPKRFSTAFFLVAQTDQQPSAEREPGDGSAGDGVTIDDGEITAHQWSTPEAALAGRDDGTVQLSPPTFLTLHQLSGFADVAAMLAWARTEPVEHFETHFVVADGHMAALYQGDISAAHPERPIAPVDRNWETIGFGPAHRIVLEEPATAFATVTAARSQGGSRWSYVRDRCTHPTRCGTAAVALPAPTLTARLADGRSIAADWLGTSGPVVVYLHGTPDCRLSRHPDDSIAERLGIQILAVDRPGCGDSDPDPDATPASVADDLVELLDQLGVDRYGLLGWSAGSLFALATAAADTSRVARVVLAAPLAPAEAWTDSAVAPVAGPQRATFAELASEMGPHGAAEALAPYLCPPDVDWATARAIVAGDDGPRDFDWIDGATDAMARGLVATVHQGLAGLERDLAAPFAQFDLSAVAAPTNIVVGGRDTVCPPVMGAWIGDRLPHAELMEVPDADHTIGITNWEQLLSVAAGLTTADIAWVGES